MRYIITGGAGFIGSNYLRLNVPKNPNNEYVVLDALTYAGRISNISQLISSPNFTFVEGKVQDRTLVASLLKQDDIVINFAAESHVDRSIKSGYDFALTNVLGTQVLLDASLQAGVKKFVQISTDEVYGSIENGSWDESFPLSPNSPYASSKAAADLIVLSYYKTHGMNVCITRCCNNYGPNQYPEKIIPFFVKNLLGGGTIPIYGTGKNIREWIHVEDHCAAIESVTEHGRSGEVYNIGTDKHITNLDLAEKILNALGLDKAKIEFVEDRKGHDLRYSLNSNKIHKTLSFEPKIDFDRGLTDTINWYKSNPEFLYAQE